MKKFILSAILYTSAAFPVGKLQLTGNYFTKDGRSLPAVGMSVYEPVMFGMYYDGFMGFGVAPRHSWPDVYWMTFRNDVSVPISSMVSISGGFTFRFSDQEWIGLEDESNLHVKLVAKLWD